MSTCFTVGIAGNCGMTCPVLHRGACENASEIEPEQLIHELGDDGIDVVLLYGEFDDYVLKHYPEYTI